MSSTKRPSLKFASLYIFELPNYEDLINTCCHVGICMELTALRDECHNFSEKFKGFSLTCGGIPKIVCNKKSLAPCRDCFRLSNYSFA